MSFSTGATNGSREFDDLEYTEEVGPNGTFGKRVVQTSWDIYPVFAASVLGSQTKMGDGGIARVLPISHPRKSWLYANQCNLVRTVGAPIANVATDFTDWKEMPAGNMGKAIFEISYESLPYDVVPDTGVVGAAAGGELVRFVERKPTYAVEALATPGRSWKWADTGKAIMEPSAVPNHLVQLTYKWWWVPCPLPESTWATMQGKINSATFDLPSFNGPTATVLFNSWETEIVWDAGGQKCAHVLFKFTYRRNGWNRFFRRFNGAQPDFSTVVDNATGTRGPFLPTDLNTIFIL